MARTVRIALVVWVLVGVIATLADDSLQWLEDARDRIVRQREEVQGYMTHNVSQQGNWSLVSFVVRLTQHHDDTEALSSQLDQLYKQGDGDFAFHRNISGFFDGNFSQIHQHLDDLSPPNISENRGAWNWSSHAKMRMELQLNEKEVKDTNVTQILGSMVLTLPRNDSNSRAGMEMDVNGIMTGRSGRVYLISVPRSSSEILDIRQILAMVPETDDVLRNDTYTMILNDIDQRLKQIDTMLHENEPYTPYDNPLSPPTNCSLHLYGQLLPAGPSPFQPQLDLRQTEREDPMGIVTARVPLMHMKILGISERCSLAIESNTLEGITTRQFWQDTRWYMCGMLVIVLIQLGLMMRMCERINTESALIKVSGPSFFIQTMYDAHVCLAHLVVGVTLRGSLSLGMLAVAFLAGVLFLAYEYPMVVAILRHTMPPAATNPPMPTPASETPPGTESRSATDDSPNTRYSAWRSRWAHVRGAVADTVRDMPRVSASLVVTVLAFSISIIMPSLLAIMLIPLLFSFWVPQIVQNYRMRTSGVNASTVIGMTLTRFYLPIYLFWYPHNLLFFEPTRLVWIPIVWLSVQMVILVGQDALGPWFFVPKAFWHHENHWNWHPTPEQLYAQLKDDDDIEVPNWAEPEDMPLGDCPVCLCPNSWDADQDQAEETTRFFGINQPTWPSWKIWKTDSDPSSNVMVTPCHHIFHTSCLKQWMNIKHICPSCRLPLPPYEDS
ncbi:hypothetical protein MPSI1_002657 [Malassezia psittaci]|uniref:RING-type E3 ubiquitin transferase n=1 Tax=Malassezia psittaci TaxID=1821823 RepID=A0AAF0JEG8_9BASI|nr:hypothetical protein MPSI1_002657 [Malassezia psittaci]